MFIITNSLFHEDSSIDLYYTCTCACVLVYINCTCILCIFRESGVFYFSYLLYFSSVWDSNFWLELDFLQVSKAAIACSSYFTGLLFLEIWYNNELNKSVKI